MHLVEHDEVGADISEPVHGALQLLDTVGLVVDRQDDGGGEGYHTTPRLQAI
jgi:hypothetical protein